MKDCGFNFKNTYIGLPDLFYSKICPEKVTNPKIIIFNKSLSDNLGLNFSNYSEKEKANLFSGNVLPKSVESIAQAYAGHQFGHFTVLGDGRAHLLGEHTKILDKNLVDIQFKGSGKTPYSRNGDGKAALSPMLREYLISEAMYFLNIPTSRSLCVVSTGEKVYRESILPGAILTRIASSHIRVGTFQFAALQKSKKILSDLLNYTIKRHYPDLKNKKNPPLELIIKLIDVQTDLIVNWMRVGFIHGVMNTDNTTLSGETIDYGPCAFMDSYNPETVFSSIDYNKRYAFDNQKIAGQWNLARFSETLLPLIDNDINKAVNKVQDLIDGFKEKFMEKWLIMMRGKLGLLKQEKNDVNIINQLLLWMKSNSIDYTNFFVELSSSNNFKEKIYKNNVFIEWYNLWRSRISRNQCSFEDTLSSMRKFNPRLIPRNSEVEYVLKTLSEKNKIEPFKEFLNSISSPYDYNIKFPERYEKSNYKKNSHYQTFCGT